MAEPESDVPVEQPAPEDDKNEGAHEEPENQLSVVTASHTNIPGINHDDPPVTADEAKHRQSKVAFDHNTIAAERKKSEHMEGPKEAPPPASGGRNRRASMFDDIYEIPGSRSKGEDETADALTGTLQNFFNKGEGQPSPVLKKVRRPKLVYENTYRLNPYRPFSSERVVGIIRETCEKMLEDTKYKSETFSNLAVQVSERIRARVMGFKYDRCKLIVFTHMGPLNRQGEHIGFRCLWDGTRDSYGFYTYTNPSIYCNVCVFGVYFE